MEAGCRPMKRWLVFAYILACSACAPEPLPPLKSYELRIGETRSLNIEAAGGELFRFRVIGWNETPLAVGLTGERYTSWSIQYDPYAGESLRPLETGAHRVDLACGEDSPRNCVFAFEAVVE